MNRKLLAMLLAFCLVLPLTACGSEEEDVREPDRPGAETQEPDKKPEVEPRPQPEIKPEIKPEPELRPEPGKKPEIVTPDPVEPRPDSKPEGDKEPDEKPAGGETVIYVTSSPADLMILDGSDKTQVLTLGNFEWYYKDYKGEPATSRAEGLDPAWTPKVDLGTYSPDAVLTLQIPDNVDRTEQILRDEAGLEIARGEGETLVSAPREGTFILDVTLTYHNDSKVQYLGKITFRK